MDRYLFRGLRTDGEGWVYGDLINLHDGRKFIINNKFGACIDDKGNFLNTEAPFVNEVIPETVGQWTGLRDKWEQMIFEGDVVKVNHLDYIQYTGVVEYCNPVCAFKVSDHGYYNDFEVDFDYEVIGNIHDGAQ